MNKFNFQVFDQLKPLLKFYTINLESWGMTEFISYFDDFNGVITQFICK